MVGWETNEWINSFICLIKLVSPRSNSKPEDGPTTWNFNWNLSRQCQTPCSWTGNLSRSAALSFWNIQYFYWVTNKWSKDLANLCALLWFVRCFCKIHLFSLSHEEKNNSSCSIWRFKTRRKLFHSLTESLKMAVLLPKVPTGTATLFVQEIVLAKPTNAVLEYCSKSLAIGFELKNSNLWLPSGKASKSDCSQITCRGSNLDSKLGLCSQHNWL